MISILRQITSVSKMNLLGLPQRIPASLSLIFSITLVVFVLLGALALNNGFEKTLNGSGSSTVAVILSDGATNETTSSITREQQDVFSTVPGIASTGEDVALSRELLVIVDGIKKSTGTEVNLPLRGMDEAGFLMRDDFALTKGRMFTPGTNEIVIGQSALDSFDGFSFNGTTRLGATDWEIVGVFESGGSVFESELWADRVMIQSLFNRGDIVQSIRARIIDANSITQMQAFSDGDPRLKLDVQSEQSYFRAQSQQTSDLIVSIGRPLAILMAIGALAGAMNTMYASVAKRSAEIATLRTIGFSRFATFSGTMVEATILAAFGGLIGMVFAYFIFDNLTASTLGGNFTQVVFEFQLSFAQLVEGAVWAVVLGLVGGLLPAWRTARRPITELLA